MSPSSGERAGSPRRFGLAVGLVVALALAWRLVLRRIYYGWEESDYGNLAMVRGVYEGGFLHYDMNHMPGYYGLSALLYAVVGDSVLAARTVTLTGGLLAIALSMFLARRLMGPGLAVLLGLLLVVQPELALYSSSSLREPVYAAFLLLMLTMLSRERLVLAGAFAAAAFLVRFDAMFILPPVLALHALGVRPRWTRLGGAFAPLLAAILGWATYTWIDHGTPFFWSHSVAVNVETGLGEEAAGPLEWTLAGARVTFALLTRVLPSRIGWGPWLGLLLVLPYLPWTRHGITRTWSLLGLLMLGFWAAVGFIGQHSPEHNLYWKWLCPIIPVILPLGLHGLERTLARPWPRPVLALAWSFAVGQALVAMGQETARQVEVSSRLYRPQLELARWIEATVPQSTPLLVDNIPGCWINRRPHERRLHTWFDVPGEGDPQAFARWLAEERVGYVLWFAEDWTQAPRVAPFLATGGSWRAGPVELLERGREDEYGWILYEVRRLDEADGDG